METHCIKADYLLKILGLQDKMVFQLILDLYEGQIDYNNFFCFFCVMSFSKIDRIIKLVLSACGIHSNYGVSKEMVESFFTKISGTAMNNEQIISFLKNNDDIITIKDLVEFIESNGELYKPFWQMRLSLVKHFFNERYYLKVIKRIMFYDNCFDRNSNTPKEPCLLFLYRIFISKEPPPYYTEYRDFETNPSDCEELFNLFILERRKQFGYSQRIGHSTPHHSSLSISDRKSSSYQKSSHKLTISTPNKMTTSFNKASQHIPNSNL